ncbi:MAG: tetratricopeptide repeat protein [Bacteroidales bacterium]|nr:tetratricopeptide repeat protein [Bacteroidales bacterium]
MGQSYEEWVDRSADYIEIDRLDSAAFALQRAMSLDPVNENNPVLLLNLGILQRQLGHYDDAYISLTASIANNPIPDVVLHRRASLLSDIGRFDEAMEDYSSLIRLYPDDVEAYYRRGVLYLEKNDRSGAEADFKKANEIDPGNMFTKLSNALIFKLDDNWAAAEKIYSALIQSVASPDPIFYMNRAECYVNSDQIFKASADLRAVGTTQRNNPYFYFLRGRVRLDQFDKVAAKADFKKAKELGYDLPIVDEWLKKTEK